MNAMPRTAQRLFDTADRLHVVAVLMLPLGPVLAVLLTPGPHWWWVAVGTSASPLLGVAVAVVSRLARRALRGAAADPSLEVTRCGSG